MSYTSTLAIEQVRRHDYFPLVASLVSKLSIGACAATLMIWLAPLIMVPSVRMAIGSTGLSWSRISPSFRLLSVTGLKRLATSISVLRSRARFGSLNLTSALLARMMGEELDGWTANARHTTARARRKVLAEDSILNSETTCDNFDLCFQS